jgi:hypothetical protein
MAHIHGTICGVCFVAIKKQTVYAYSFQNLVFSHPGFNLYFDCHIPVA